MLQAALEGGGAQKHSTRAATLEPENPVCAGPGLCTCTFKHSFGALTREPCAPNFHLAPDCTYSGAKPDSHTGGSLVDPVQLESKVPQRFCLIHWLLHKHLCESLCESFRSRGTSEVFREPPTAGHALAQLCGAVHTCHILFKGTSCLWHCRKTDIGMQPCGFGQASLEDLGLQMIRSDCNINDRPSLAGFKLCHENLT